MLLYLDGEEQLPRCCVCTIFATNKIYLSGSGCGSVGRAVASDSRGLQFEFSHWQKIILNIYCQLYWKDENKEKEAESGPFKNKIDLFLRKTLLFFLGRWNEKPVESKVERIKLVNSETFDDWVRPKHRDRCSLNYDLYGP